MSRIIEKKIEMAKKSNTRVVFCNTPEATVMTDLLVITDKIYKFLRKNAGTEKIDSTMSIKYRQEFLQQAKAFENFLLQISDEISLHNISKSGILKRIATTTLTKKEKING